MLSGKSSVISLWAWALLGGKVRLGAEQRRVRGQSIWPNRSEGDICSGLTTAISLSPAARPTILRITVRQADRIIFSLYLYPGLSGGSGPCLRPPLLKEGCIFAL